MVRKHSRMMSNDITNNLFIINFNNHWRFISNTSYGVDIQMKARIFYVTKKAFRDDPSWIFTNAEKTEQQLNQSGLKNFVEINIHEDQDVKSKLEYAEKLFMIYNGDQNPLGKKEGQDKIRKLGASHTSMSINDFVVIDGSILIVDNIGFKDIGFHKILEDIDLK